MISSAFDAKKESMEEREQQMAYGTYGSKKKRTEKKERKKERKKEKKRERKKKREKERKRDRQTDRKTDRIKLREECKGSK